MFFKIYSYTSKDFLFKILKKQPIEAVAKLKENIKNFLEYYNGVSNYMDLIKKPNFLNLIQRFMSSMTEYKG